MHVTGVTTPGYPGYLLGSFGDLCSMQRTDVCKVPRLALLAKAANRIEIESAGKH